MGDRDHLNEFEQLLMLSILRLGDDAYGATIRQDLAGTAKRSVSIATIYVALIRLEKRGLVRSWMSDPTPVRGGRSKRQYLVEPPGIKALQTARMGLERMWSGVAPELHPKSSTR